MARVGYQLRQRTEQFGIELAALVDLATGGQVGATVEGAEDRIPLRPQLAMMQPGRRYAHIHTHPRSSSFTDLDVGVLLDHPELRTVTVVGHDGTWYVLSKLRGRPTAGGEDGAAAWLRAYSDRYTEYEALIQSRALTEAEAIRQQTHEIMVRIAPELRLRYDRLERQ